MADLGLYFLHLDLFKNIAFVANYQTEGRNIYRKNALRIWGS